MPVLLTIWNNPSVTMEIDSLKNIVGTACSSVFRTLQGVN